MSSATAWTDALTAISLFSMDPVGLGGIVVRAGAGPVRDRWLARLKDALPPRCPVRRVPLHVGDDRLLGGLDLAATLGAGRPIAQQGLLAEADGGVVLVAMAERLDPAVAARLFGVMDCGAVSLLRDGLAVRSPARFGVIALDEGIGPDEAPPPGLLDRLAFHVDLTGIGMGDMSIDCPPTHSSCNGRPLPASCQRRPAPTPVLHAEVHVVGSDVRRYDEAVDGSADQNALASEDLNAAPHADPAEILCSTAASLGIGSLRAPVLALRAARAAAALGGRYDVTVSDLTVAARLVLAPRATCLPPSEEPNQQQDDASPPPSDEAQSNEDTPPADDPPPAEDAAPNRPLADIVLSATRAALPPDLLARITASAGARLNSRTPGRAGQVQASLRRGRPIGTRQGELRPGTRLHIFDTLKAAAPWQTLRQSPSAAAPPRPLGRSQDAALGTVREQPNLLSADRNFRVMAGPRVKRSRAGSGPRPTTLTLATSKDAGGRPEPVLGQALGPTRGPAMTRKLQRNHLEVSFPDGHLAQPVNSHRDAALAQPGHRSDVTSQQPGHRPDTYQAGKMDPSSAPRIAVRRHDFRIVRFRQRTRTATVFAVDASGSAALHRLAEAKGAVELLLADCYVRRDQVALIAFRGRSAELLLPPTGSLLRAKRCLAGLPGGGATPLAAGIDAAVALADGLRRRGRTPVITLLTDGRANMTRDGSGGRQQGEAEALASARLLRATGLAALLVDTSPRPNPFARRLAEEMRAQYVPLPYADATALSRAVRSAAAA